MGSRQVAPGLTVHNDAGVSHTRVDNAISALLEHPGIAAHLAKYPLNVIIGKNTTGTGGHGGGLYQSAKTVGDIKLAATAHVNLIERMSAGRYSPSLSGEAKTADEKNATTLIHEVGHHVHQTTIPVGMKMHEHSRGSRFAHSFGGEASRARTAERTPRSISPKTSPQCTR